MPIVPSELAASPDAGLSAKLAEHAIGAAPAWLWSADGPRLLWANAAGAALFGAANVSECVARGLDAEHPAAVAVARLAATLPASGRSWLQRLRGFGTNLGNTLTCTSSRTTLADGSVALFVAATETAEPQLSLGERVAGLLAGAAEPLAAFAADGTMLFANKTAAERLGRGATLSSLGLEALAAQAKEAGAAAGDCAHGPLTIDRVTGDGAAVLIARFAPAPSVVRASGAAPAATLTPAEPPSERRHPLRFVWQMDTQGRFVAGSPEFVDLLGPRSTAAFGRPWRDIAADLNLDPDNAVERAVATRETWSGITVSWPAGDRGERVPVELSGLPVFDRNREFRGYRGFGVCRDLARLGELTRARAERPAGSAGPAGLGAAAAIADEDDAIAQVQGSSAAGSGGEPPPMPVEAPAERLMPRMVLAAAANVVPFRQSASAESKGPGPTLSPVEHTAFRELAQELTARLRGTADGAAGDGSAMATETEFANAGLATLAGAAAVALAGAELAASLNETVETESQQADVAAQDQAFNSEAIASEALNRETLDREALDRETLDRETLDRETLDRYRSMALALAKAEAEVRKLKTTLAAAQQSEAELRAAAREAQKAAVARADFVAKVSHEIRTPLNAIAGFAEVIIAERFGPIGNERYREYLQDIHAAGTHLVALLNDTVDLSKIETDQFDLVFAHINLNELTQQCVGIMQPQASRARIIIRSSLTSTQPQVVADERTLRQIVLNLIAHSIRFTGPGGQVIVSSAQADSGEAILRVRDTGVGMSEKDVEALLEPFRQTATSASFGSGGTGIGLTLTKALVEANRAHFSIKSAPNAGTLIEVAFPPARVVPQ
jgi:signal transduction histidine kinase/PAS domain-containing protein